MPKQQRDKKRARAEAVARRAALQRGVQEAEGVQDWLAQINPFFSRYDPLLLGALGEGVESRGPFLLRYLWAENMPRDWTSWAFDLLKENMQALYEGAWGWSDKGKRAELRDSSARFLVAMREEDGQLAGFVHVRFTVAEELRVAYVYEIQVAKEFQRQGLGRFLMKVTSFIASQAGMDAVDLTVFKENHGAMSFYHSLGYTLAPDSPSLHGDLTQPHELLRKVLLQPSGTSTAVSSSTSTSTTSSLPETSDPK